MAKARLKSVPNRLAGVPSALSQPQGEQQRNRFRRRTQEQRRWYSSARWQRLALVVKQRDNWTCVKTGVVCWAKAPAPNSAIADHIIPPRGDATLFWDIENIQTVSKAYHDSEKQRQDKARV